jgi:acylphosphatase
MSDIANSPDSSDASFRAVISGRVQGVGFRYFVQKRAVALGIAGLVFNRGDGAVEVLARADRARLDAFLGELRRGPAMSSVDRIDLDWNAAAPPGDGFRITHG